MIILGNMGATQIYLDLIVLYRYWGSLNKAALISLVFT